MVWNGESQRHNMSRKGIKSSIGKPMPPIYYSWESDVKEVIQSFMEAALWTSEMDEYSIYDFHPNTVIDITRDVTKFMTENYNLIKQSNLTLEQVGHDFWFSRNHHGVGFFDRKYDGCPKNVCDSLHKSAQEYPEKTLFLHEGKVYME